MISPPPRLVSALMLASKFRAEFNVIPPVVAIKVPPEFVAVDPRLVTVIDPPVTAAELPALTVPSKVRLMGPPFDAVTAPPLKKLWTFRTMPEEPAVVRSAPKVSVPPVSTTETDAAENAANVASVQLLIVRAPMG